METSHQDSPANSAATLGADQPAVTKETTTKNRPLAITILAIFSLLIGVIDGIPQLYYVLYAINPHVFPIGPNANPLGAIWYNYILGGQQGGYLKVDPGTLAGAIEDAFMLAPLYITTGIGLLRQSKWVYPVGLITGSMIFYANLYFLLSGTLVSPQNTVTENVTTVLSSIPWFVYPLWLIPTLLLRKSLFRR